MGVGWIRGDFPLAGHVKHAAKPATPAQSGVGDTAMYDFKVDAHTRLLIAQALLDNETISIITLHSGSQLRVICHFGHVALELITREKDLFGDVFDQVEEVLHG